MSAINVWMQSHYALVMVDTKAIDAEGFHFNATKSAILPHRRLIVAIRGDTALLRIVTYVLEQVATDYNRGFNYFLSNFDKLLDAEYTDPLEAAAVKKDCDVVIVGWSDTGDFPGPRGFHAWSRDGVRKIGSIAGCVLQSITSIR